MGFTSAARSSCEEAAALRFDCGMARLFADGGLSPPRRAATRYGYRRYRSPHHPLITEGGSCAARLARPSGAGGVYLRESAFLRIGWAGPFSRRGLAPCRASIEKAAMSPSGRLLQRARVLHGGWPGFVEGMRTTPWKTHSRHMRACGMQDVCVERESTDRHKSSA